MGMEEPEDVVKIAEPQRQHVQPYYGPWLFEPLSMRMLLIVTGVIIPIVCFVYDYPESPRWQSGTLSTYAKLLLARPSCVPQYPFLLYSMVCLTLLACNSAKWSRKFLVRLGVYVGALIALEFWMLFALAFDNNPVIGLLVTTIGSTIYGGLLTLALWAVSKIVRHFRHCWPYLTVGVLMIMALALPVWIDEGTFFFVNTLQVYLLVSLLFSTPLALAAYSFASFDLVRHQGRFRFSLAQLLGVVTWLAAHFGAWRASVDWMLIEYAKLPTETPDDCYVCTAAARGHAWLTGIEHGGRPISEQMRRLKAVELIMRHTSPRLHRVCRAIYDRIGPMLAARLGNPWLADVAYLSLKPAEWACGLVLRCLLPKRGIEAVRRFYGPGR